MKQSSVTKPYNLSSVQNPLGYQRGGPHLTAFKRRKSFWKVQDTQDDSPHKQRTIRPKVLQLRTRCSFLRRRSHHPRWWPLFLCFELQMGVATWSKRNEIESGETSKGEENSKETTTKSETGVRSGRCGRGCWRWVLWRWWWQRYVWVSCLLW